MEPRKYNVTAVGTDVCALCCVFVKGYIDYIATSKELSDSLTSEKFVEQKGRSSLRTYSPKAESFATICGWVTTIKSIN